MVLQYLKRRLSRRSTSSKDTLATAESLSSSVASRGRKVQRQEPLDDSTRRISKKGASSRKSSPVSDETTSSDVSGVTLPCLLESFAREGKWDTFLQTVTKSTVDDWNTLSVASVKKTLQPNTTSPLHIAMAHRPTLEVVDKLITLMKERFNVAVPEEFKDAAGRTPLHVGAMYHCNDEVTARLLNGDNLLMPAVIRDNMDRTPLHLATFSPILKPAKKSFFGKNRMAEDRWNKRRLVFLLLEHYPEAATLTDSDGKTPLDYARENNLSESSLSFIRRMEEVHAPDEPKELDTASAVEATKEFLSLETFLGGDSACFSVQSQSQSFISFRSSSTSNLVGPSDNVVALLGDMDRDDDDACEDMHNDGVSSIGYQEAEMFNYAG